MLCAIWYHLYNFKNMKNPPWRSVTFSKIAGLLKVRFPHGCFSHFLNRTNSTKSRKASLKQLKVTCNSPCNCILVLITSNGFENKQAPQAATPPVKHSNKRPMISCVANSISEVNFLNAILQKTSPKQWYHCQSKTTNQKVMVTSTIKCFFWQSFQWSFSEGLIY